MAIMELETNSKPLVNHQPLPGVSFAPIVTPDYWLFRVKLSETQAVLAFPKFGIVGIGFAVEKEDWNTNLPFNCPTREIYRHIEKNKGDPAITEDDCLKAIRMLQEAVAKSRGENLNELINRVRKATRKVKRILMGRTELIEIRNLQLIEEREKALCVQQRGDARKIWLARSLIEYLFRHQQGTTKLINIKIPEWLSEEKDLY
jgi:hypothetical protein